MDKTKGFLLLDNAPCLRAATTLRNYTLCISHNQHGKNRLQVSLMLLHHQLFCRQPPPSSPSLALVQKPARYNMGGGAFCGTSGVSGKALF